jgi:exopolyphosphatase
MSSATNTAAEGSSKTKLSQLWPISPASCNRLNEYLSRARARIAPDPRLCCAHIFIGNEGADLDSIVSAVVLAYASERSGRVADSVPIVNCFRADFPLRGDAYAALTAAGIDVSQLVFIDESNVLASKGDVTLVDHNEPASHQRALSCRVRGIVDHHEDTMKHLDANPRVVDMIGSCCTVVYELCPQILKGEGMDETAAMLVLCAILVDTRNMTGGASRDANAIASIQSSLQISEELRGQIFQELYERKADQSGLSTRDLLRRDYKRFEGGGKLVGISSAGISLHNWSTRDLGKGHELTAQILQQWAQQQAVDVLIVMTLHGSMSNLSRELLICPSTPRSLHLARYALCFYLPPAHSTCTLSNVAGTNYLNRYIMFVSPPARSLMLSGLSTWIYGP